QPAVLRICARAQPGGERGLQFCDRGGGRRLAGRCFRPDAKSLVSDRDPLGLELLPGSSFRVAGLWDGVAVPARGLGERPNSVDRRDFWPGGRNPRGDLRYRPIVDDTRPSGRPTSTSQTDLAARVERMNLANLLLRAARSFGERPAVFAGRRPLHSYRELAQRAAALSNSLVDPCGLLPGERVALILHNHPAYLELLFAIWHGGLVAVPINAKLHPRELAYILQHSGSKLCFVSEDLADGVVEANAQLPAPARVITVNGEEYARLIHGRSRPIIDRRPEDVAWLFYT